jgi:hypothetical protein
MPTITREQLQSIEWGDTHMDEPSCPVCFLRQCDGQRHAPNCWLAAALATPDTLPPVAVGDVVLTENGGVEYVRNRHAEDYWTGADAEGFPDVAERRKARILAIYRTPLWQRKETS